MYDVRLLGLRFSKAVTRYDSVRAEIALKTLKNTAPRAGQQLHAARAN